MKAAKNAHGVTVNDAVVSMCAGAVRRWLLQHDELPEEPLVAQIPVSVRSSEESGTYGNRILLSPKSGGAGAGVTKFTISATVTDPAVTDLKLYQAGTDLSGPSVTSDSDTADLLIHTASGNVYRVPLDGKTTVGDVLTAIRFGSPSITGIEVNQAMVGALEGPYRLFSPLVDHPGVRLVHDEARSYLTRAGQRFDVLQMSLIDTWAATGAGAFTLSENGLYTREAWQVFLRSLTPTGVFSVSRWFDPGNASETTRLLALGVAALLETAMQLGASPSIRNAVRFAFWGAEESGLQGSTEYVRGLGADGRRGRAADR